MILDRIIETKKKEVAALKRLTSAAALEQTIATLSPCRDFVAALCASPCAIIAEVKCASPSRGRLVDPFDPIAIAKTYEQNGAAAISVLTDEQYFLGHKDDLRQIRSEVAIPVLRKDFMIDPIQLFETRALGADAVLLIVRILGKSLAGFIRLAENLGLHALVEVHTEKELDAALAAGARIIGINNRNLDTFVTDLNTSRVLADRIPAGIPVVAESALQSRHDLENLMQAGIHAFLIGEGLVTARDIGRKLKTFLGETP